MWIVIVVIVAFILIGVIAGTAESKKETERGEAMKEALVSIPDFTPTMKIAGAKNLFTFATDNEHQKILYMPGTNPQVYNYEDIISVELIEDNEIVSKKSTGRTIGGAVLGGVVAGGVGAIVGGLSGASKQHQLHSSVKVKILLRNNAVPSIELNCFDAKTMTIDGKPVTGEDMLYRQGICQAKRITDTLTVIIDAVDRAMTAQQRQAPVVMGSVAEEIAKLAALREKGILTEEEFSAQKSKLLAGEQPANPSGPLKLVLPKDPLDDELKEIIATKGILKAIVRYKEMTGADLATAKAYVESLC